MAHTVEPWRESPVRRDAIVADNSGGHSHDEGELRYYGGHLVAESISAENRRRIIACVNFCAGISTGALETLGAGALARMLGVPE